MYKIMIVDDEPEVRDGIKESMEWERHGFQFIGDYANGSEAIEAISEHRPDLVVSDICMPFMDGIELTEHISTQYPYVKVIILTGYDEFEYAQKALRLKVYDFIIKPITARELRELLDRVKADMDRESQQRENLTALKMQLQQSLPLLKERFLEQMVSGSLKESQIREKLQYFCLPPLQPPYLVAAIDIDDLEEMIKGRWDNDPELLRSAVYNIVMEVMEGKEAAVFRTRDERMVVLFTGEPEERLYESSLHLSEVIRFCTEKYLKLTVTIGVGMPCGSLSDLALSYQGAAAALDYRFLLGKNRVICIQDMEGVQTAKHQLELAWNSRFSTVIKTGSLQEVNALTEQFIHSLGASLKPIGVCYLQIQSVLIAIVNAIHEWADDGVHWKGHEWLSTDMRRFQTLDEIGQWLQSVCQEAVAFITGQRSDLTKMQVKRVIAYLEEQYGNENISLQDLCRHVHLSKSYFSAIFKQHTGQTPMEYLTRIRIDKAKELLCRTPMKFYEIAVKVGYSDPQYFSALFKKHTGTTPTEYRTS